MNVDCRIQILQLKHSNIWEIGWNSNNDGYWIVIDARRFSDSDIEIFRQRHQEISTSVNNTDDFLMFHNAAAFCCQLFDTILLLYDFIFFRAAYDPVVVMMRVYWMFGVLSGLAVTTAGGIMVNHYVSTSVSFADCDT